MFRFDGFPVSLKTRDTFLILRCWNWHEVSRSQQSSMWPENACEAYSFAAAQGSKWMDVCSLVSHNVVSPSPASK